MDCNSEIAMMPGSATAGAGASPGAEAGWGRREPLVSAVHQEGRGCRGLQGESPLFKTC